MIRRNFLPLLPALLLLACAAQAADKNEWVNYTCADGQTLQASYPDHDTAVIKLKGKTHHLQSVKSGSGARYIGDGWQWWTKGMHNGELAPLSARETLATAPALQCHAP